MEVKKFSAVAKYEVEIETKSGVEKLIFSVRPLPQFRVAEYRDEPESERLVSLLQDAVVDWNLESDGQKLPCNEENKKKYLPAIFDLIDTKGVAVGTGLLTFCGDSKNFFVA